MQFNLKIPCPVCQNPIPADSNQLISGTKFTCPVCNTSIGLSQKSTEVVESAMTEFSQFKKEAVKNQ